MPNLSSIARFSGAVALCLGLQKAAAQDLSADRSGVVGSIGVGAGTAGVSCVPRCQGDRRSAATISVRGGVNVSPYITLALAVDAFRAHFPIANGNGRWALTWTTLDLLWYPRAEEDFFIKAGGGVGAVRAHSTFPVVGALNLKASSLGFVVGIGRDFRLTDNIAVTAYADYLGTTRTISFIANAESGARISADVINLGLALTVF